MNIKVVNEKEEKLLNRKDILINLDFEDKTPSREVIKKELVEKLKIDPELLKIKKIQQEFGDRKAKVFAYLYNSKESLNKIEVKNKKKKVVKKEEKK
ncbi:hypothetical protein HYX16_02565 [Candidatus Woesearchaeota archaeon]|nr:hypothetical protein [Candidatus Woesearchaeota archaeon]